MAKLFSLVAMVLVLLFAKQAAATVPDEPARNEYARMWLTLYNEPDIVGNCYVDTVPCLAATLWHEARSDVQGACFVAWVIRNRVSNPRFPSTLASVIEESNQFSYADDGRSDKVIPANSEELRVWYDLYQTAYDVVTGTGECGEDPTGGALFYYATRLGSNPKKVLGVKGLVRTATQGGHLFFALGPAR